MLNEYFDEDELAAGEDAESEDDDVDEDEASDDVGNEELEGVGARGVQAGSKRVKVFAAKTPDAMRLYREGIR